MDCNPAKNTVQLEFHIPDFEVAKKYYGALGFDVVWEREPEGLKGYLVMKLADNVLCFWNGTPGVYKQGYFKKFSKDSPRGVGVEIVIMVHDIEEYFEKVRPVANVVESLQPRPWGSKDFRVIDPFGYYVRFSSRHNVLDPGNAVK
jgi:uncharacterized glyoxalase superfamily protein PhnB